ncbi:MAG: T9SS type A sorting domain-containing protein, partial [bacterium]
GSQEIWAQKLSPNGEILGQENGIPLVRGIGGNATEPKAFSRWDGSFTVIWLDGRFGGIGQFPFIQTIQDLNDRPEILLTTNGVPALEGTVGGGINPQACPDGESGTIVVWEDHRAGEVYAIYAQRINRQGDRLWGDGGVKVAEHDFEQSWPYVAPDNEGGAFIAWRALTDGDYFDVYMQRLSPQGARLWGDAGVRITSHDMDEEVEQLIPDELGGAILVWKAYNDIEGTDDDLWITRIDPQGNILWGENGDNGIVLVDAFNKQRNAHAIRHPRGIFVTWVDGRDDEEGQPQYDIFGQMISLNGEILWRQGGLIICGDSHHQENPKAVRDNETNIWVVWEDHRWAGTRRQRDIYLQKISPNLTPQGTLQTFFERDGIPICGSDYDQLSPSIAHDGQNGVWVAWEDYRGGLWSDIYAIHLNPDGERYQPWEANGNVVTAAFHKQQGARLVNLHPMGNTGIAIVWEDKRATGKEELSNVFIQRLDDGQLSVLRESPAQPDGFQLLEVYPNPFNNQAIVTLNFARPGRAKLSLYDLQGRMVKTIVQRTYSAGRHRVTLFGNELGAGTYVLKLESSLGNREEIIQLLR